MSSLRFLTALSFGILEIVTNNVFLSDKHIFDRGLDGLDGFLILFEQIEGDGVRH
jgi:hypothetical protein